VWATATGSWHGAGNDSIYTPTTSFETFPFPPPRASSRQAVSGAAVHLVNTRHHLLQQNASLTLTKLYNDVAVLIENRDATARAFTLLLAHEALDIAVADAYGWSWPMADAEILERLLALNLERSAAEPS
jgi:hypothetical protein